MRWFYPLLVIAFSSGMHAQGIDELKRYEEGKKERSTALAISLLVPGGGMMYSGNEIGGVAVLGASIGSSWWLWNSIRDNDELTFPLVTTILLRIADVAFAFDWIDAHNADLLNKLRIRVGVDRLIIGFSL